MSFAGARAAGAVAGGARNFSSLLFDIAARREQAEERAKGTALQERTQQQQREYQERMFSAQETERANADRHREYTEKLTFAQALAAQAGKGFIPVGARQVDPSKVVSLPSPGGEPVQLAYDETADLDAQDRKLQHTQRMTEIGTQHTNRLAEIAATPRSTPNPPQDRQALTLNDALITIDEWVDNGVFGDPATVDPAMRQEYAKRLMNGMPLPTRKQPPPATKEHRSFYSRVKGLLQGGGNPVSHGPAAAAPAPVAPAPGGAQGGEFGSAGQFNPDLPFMDVRRQKMVEILNDPAFTGAQKRQLIQELFPGRKLRNQ